MGGWLTPNRRIVLVATLVVVLDQLTKQVVKHCLGLDEEKEVVPGFFKFVHWGNTGAAWSLFSGRNAVLAVVGVVALVVLFRSRHHFDAHTKLGQVALGLIFGGIVGDLADRLIDHYVTDFLYFYLDRRGRARSAFRRLTWRTARSVSAWRLIFIASFRNEKPHDAVAH